MASLNDIRSTFLDFFRRNDHRIVASSPLVPRNDPTLMFTNSGMVQFKNLFTGVETRDYNRASTAQKCVRAGGKHNDLENVGYTARHHTFFEMLGNFSFGDYFKAQAIPYAWELLTKDFGLNRDKLLVTVYHTDDEAAGIWKKVAGLSDDRIIRILYRRHPWRMGPTGPRGPCTEIMTTATILGAALRVRRRRTATASSRSGTSSSCRTSSSRTARCARSTCRSRSTPAWAGADRRASAGQARHLRHRPDAQLHRGLRMRPRPIPTGRARSTTG